MSALSSTARVARGATYVFFQGFFTSIVTVIYFVLLARVVSQEDMGVFALLSFLLVLPQILGTFGLSSAAIKYIPQHLAENAPEKAKAVVARLLQIGFLSGIVTFLLLFVPAESISTWIFGQSNYAFFLRLLALCSIFNVVQILASSFLQGLQRMREVAFINIVYTIIQVVLSSYLLLAGFGLLGVVVGWVVGTAAIAIVGLILTIKYLGLTSQLYSLGPLLRFSIPLYFSSIVTYFIGWVDQLVLATFTDLETVGIYYVAVRASAVPMLFPSAIVTALFPKLSELYTIQGIDSFKEAFRVSVRYAVLIGFPLILGIAALAYPTIVLFAGPQYAEAAMPLIIISLSAITGTLGIATGPILLTLGQTKLVSLLSLTSVASSFFLSYFALNILHSGMVGIAWARTVSSAIWLVVSLYLVARFVTISFDKQALWKASAASGCMVLAIVGLDLVRMVLSPSSYQFLAIRLSLLPVYIIVGALVYFVAIILLRTLNKQDLELILEYLPKRVKWVADLLRRIAKVE